jgi:hypothetical protein
VPRDFNAPCRGRLGVSIGEDLSERLLASEFRAVALREALEFYGDPVHWDGAAEAIWVDSGSRARAALVENGDTDEC